MKELTFSPGGEFGKHCKQYPWVILKVGIRAAKRPDKAWSPSVKIGTIFWKLMQSENVSSTRPGEVTLYRLTVGETSLSQQLIRSSTLHTKTWWYLKRCQVSKFCTPLNSKYSCRVNSQKKHTFWTLRGQSPSTLKEFYPSCKPVKCYSADFFPLRGHPPAPPYPLLYNESSAPKSATNCCQHDPQHQHQQQ